MSHQRDMVESMQPVSVIFMSESETQNERQTKDYVHVHGQAVPLHEHYSQLSWKRDSSANRNDRLNGTDSFNV